MSEFADRIIADLHARARKTFTEFGQSVAGGLQKNISVPVQRVRGRVIRSRPGENPRKDSGRYHGSIGNKTETGRDRVVTTIYTNNVIGAYLEHGTSRMASRPHFKPIFDAFARRFLSFISTRMFR